ncbi:hypothetical protein ARALYDRAFT_494490 [Arabidopsis lyrata subsp. lyrata]|uniref:Exostosin GT47 domain-containing protein n=1 Tax=Arabidopsis lyrata subsp. lyrata TaxID=81972 RepID=D7MLF5_ARALL|nr:hypothetical protein ARALYDRAFT_494490 [Arabidopsis lyrata subsp. lyrata]
MKEKLNPKIRKPNNSSSKKVTVSFLSVFFVFVFVNTFFYPSFYSDSGSIRRNLVDSRESFDFPEKLRKTKVYMYDLPTNFTHGVIQQHGGEKSDDVTGLKYPGHQHMHYHFHGRINGSARMDRALIPFSSHLSNVGSFSTLTRPEIERVGSPIVRVFDPAEADLFFVAAFSSLSLIVNSDRPEFGSGFGYSEEVMQESLVSWLEGQEWCRRNNGRDHVIVAGDPNALNRVMDRVKNAVLLVTDLGWFRADQGSLVKDVIIPYSHRVDAYEGELGVKQRNNLLYRETSHNLLGSVLVYGLALNVKYGGRVRDLLFKLLENEEDVVIKHGTQSRENRRAAKQGMHTSKFCLHSAGDTHSACRLFDALASLCVPVIVSDGIELPFEDDAALKPGFVVKKLRKVKPEKILKYQKAMKEVRRYFDYTHPNGSVNEIWRQVTKKIPLIKLMINREKRMIKREGSDLQCSCLCLNQTGIIHGV